MAGEEPKTVPVSTIEVDTDSPVASTKYDSDRERQESPTQPLPGKSTFETEDHRLYRPIDSYEGIHRWDPDFRWTEEEERKIVRKIDWRVCTFACVTFFALQLDRGNIGQALSDTLLKDLKMTSNDYNTGQTIFLVCFLIAEMPSQLISKRLGPDRWIPIQMVAWSLVAACQAFLKTKSAYLGLRALLGLLEGGFIPDTILFLSFFYKSSELPKRLTCFWISYTLTSIIGAFLAFGLLHIKDSNGGGSWRYLFAYEGLITGIIGILAAFWMPAGPTQTKGGLRGKDGWFNEREEKIMVNRVIRDDPSKGTMHNRQAVTPKLLWYSLKDYHMWPIYALGLIWMIPYTPAANYLTLQLRQQGFTTFQTNLLVIPSAVVSIITMVTTTWLAERTNQRLLCGAAVEIWYLILLIALETLPMKSMPWPRFAILTLTVGGPSIHPVVVALTSRNAGSVRTRTVASALYNMSVQISSIAAANVYRADDAPYYREGNKVTIALAVVSFFLFIGAKLYYDWRNKRNAKQWDALTSEQKRQYLQENSVMTNKRLDFRFAS
ncbi:major facilitator superfamily domain-containing protein [Aspergillus pseudonomiae]|uniref:Major facilitator superfamily domain-containing protein n=1 Tax=Aspergillus pseudonomiae TaxID=1506151 RepID=A0A5N7D8G0_9EURO|nr:major facilitator superfamily domain-containing protein [Aspergillus pseudonomiae]KAB8262113.1 major facilitator superfamily domain-containing protein [Aspergillus pseudonomiae]KAE8402691.1 major facilitator superfamily domain-containing protein [Aspergillus pseudonomiae]